MQRKNMDLPEKLVSVLKNVTPLKTGGQKKVFNAIHDELGDVVYKVILNTGNSVDIERARREIRAVELLNSEYVPKIYDHNCNEENAAFLWILEQYIDGGTLREHLQGTTTFDINSLVNFLDIMLSIAVLSEEKDLVHRDIKPGNIIFDLEGKFWLLDFGISRHLDLESITESNQHFGLFTFGYASSEQFRNIKKEIDIRADLFSIGVVATEMILGFNPYLKNTNDPLVVLRRIENSPLPPIQIPGDTQFQLATFIKILGDSRQSRRPRSAKEAQAIFQTIKPTLELF